MCAVGINTCSSRLCPTLQHRSCRWTRQHTLCFFLRRRACHHTLFISPLWCSTCQHTYSIIKAGGFPPAHIFTREKQNYYPSAHTSVLVAHSKLSPQMPCKYLHPASTHRALAYFVCPPSAHILSGSYQLNLQPRITVQRAEPPRQHTYRTRWLRNGLRSHIVVAQAW